MSNSTKMKLAELEVKLHYCIVSKTDCLFNLFLSFFPTDGIAGVDQTGLVATHRIKKLITDLKQCVYMEASALTGENVDRVFNTG